MGENKDIVDQTTDEVQVIIFEEATNANEIIEEDRNIDMTVENRKNTQMEETKSIHDRDTEMEKADEIQVSILEKTKKVAELNEDVNNKDFKIQEKEKLEEDKINIKVEMSEDTQIVIESEDNNGTQQKDEDEIQDGILEEAKKPTIVQLKDYLKNKDLDKETLEELEFNKDVNIQESTDFVIEDNLSAEISDSNDIINKRDVSNESQKGDIDILEKENTDVILTDNLIIKDIIETEQSNITDEKITESMVNLEIEDSKKSYEEDSTIEGFISHECNMKQNDKEFEVKDEANEKGIEIHTLEEENTIVNLQEIGEIQGEEFTKEKEININFTKLEEKQLEDSKEHLKSNIELKHGSILEECSKMSEEIQIIGEEEAIKGKEIMEVSSKIIRKEEKSE